MQSENNLKVPMASSFSQLTIIYFFACNLLILLASARTCTSCYTSVFGFGDSLTDAGNLIHLYPPDRKPHMYFPPYGKTYFHHPTGRCSDGRLLIDLIAQHYGLPLPPPSIDARDGRNIQAGINFAVVGSRAVDAQFYEKRGMYDKVTNVSMWDQLEWFKQMLPHLCHNPSGCKKFLESSLFLLGEFGGNDYTHSLLSGKNLNDILPIIPVVVQSIASGAHELVELGAKTIMVPSVLPFGCASSYLTYFESWNEDDYDEIGCLIWPNEFASYHNELLQKELHRLRELHPHVNIIYADYYNAAMQLYRAPRRYGFLEGALVACCGGGGPYNFNIFALCGIFPATSCEDPNQYVNWDGYHLTEAAYRWMTKSLLEGPFTYPPIKNLCPFGINEAQVSQI
ncbi:GDSL esterase/lipase At1g28610-like isoform X2 [Lycium ferocissimum]|uniref:GDSL esterase/lipase At1g28610-like isoform X2 n=1 Tax=Lycium ferocissimum TaxID=112874 RepID=UPI002815E03D|nr:GDSL esterase/lipase At1g28610-like isoform X2 [Lycium ferocissimum]